MPKIILDIESRIFDAAKKLFCTKGFDNVNMKTIAKEANLAVGSLYNYYSNKDDLYMEIVRYSWEKTFNNLKNIEEKDISKKSKLKESIDLIYDNLSDKHGLGMQIKKSVGMDSEKFNDFQSWIIGNLKLILYNFKIKEKYSTYNKIREKIIFSLLINSTFLLNNFKENKEENLEFLYSLCINFLVLE